MREYYSNQVPTKLNIIINPQIPYEYLRDIYLNLSKEELQFKINHYLQFQNQINDKMRGILIDWLIEVHHKFNLQEETIFLTVNLIDRFLSKEMIPRTCLQLLGVSSLLIACKQEEILVPCISDLVFVTDNAYSKTDVFNMEKKILNILDFNVVIPSSLRLFEIISQNYRFTPEQLSFGKYILVLNMLNYKMLKYNSSVIACSTAYIVMKYFKITHYASIYENWNINSNVNELKQCAKEICYMIDTLDTFYTRAAIRRFSSDDYHHVALITFS